MGRDQVHRCIHNYDNKMSPAVIKMLLDSGADPNARDGLGQTPLILVSRRLRDNLNWQRREWVATTQDLLDAGADVNARDKNGAMALSILLSQVPSASVLMITAMILWRGAREDGLDRGEKPMDVWNVMGSLRGVVHWRFWKTHGGEYSPKTGVLRKYDRGARYDFGYDEDVGLKR